MLSDPRQKALRFDTQNNPLVRSPVHFSLVGRLAEGAIDEAGKNSIEVSCLRRELPVYHAEFPLLNEPLLVLDKDRGPFPVRERAVGTGRRNFLAEDDKPLQFSQLLAVLVLSGPTPGKNDPCLTLLCLEVLDDLGKSKLRSARRPLLAARTHPQ